MRLWKNNLVQGPVLHIKLSTRYSGSGHSCLGWDSFGRYDLPVVPPSVIKLTVQPNLRRQISNFNTSTWSGRNDVGLTLT